MAALCKIKEEEQNFIKISFLNFKHSPILVRQFFDRNIPPNQLAHTINLNMNCIMGLIRTKRINAAQEDILRSIPGTVWPPKPSTSASVTPSTTSTSGTPSNDFDLTLMICLLRNFGIIIPPTNGWDQLPNGNEKTDGAYLARLKYYRNMFAHTTKTSIPTQKFKDIWTSVEEALIHFNGGQAITEITDLFHRDFDYPNTTIQTELANLKQQYLLCESEKVEAVHELAYYKEGHLPRNIEENMNSLVESWRTDDDLFYETSGTKAIYKKIRSSHFVTVTGNSGAGKTAAIRHIALRFKSEGFQIIPVESSDKIIDYRRQNTKQCFLVDDVIGKYGVDPRLLELWERQDDHIRQFLNDSGKTKVLCTLRNQVALNKRFAGTDSVLRDNVVDLGDNSISITPKEKRCIFLKHVNQKSDEVNIDEKVIDEICRSQHDFFPLLCRLSTSNEERMKDVAVFFHKPFQVLERELEKLQTTNKEAYCSLVLCMLLKGSIPENLFHYDHCDDIFLNTIEACGLDKTISRSTIHDSIKTLVGSYFRFEQDSYKFVHDALHESVSLHFSHINPQAMFRLCDITDIRDRVKCMSDLNLIEDIAKPIHINEQHFEALAFRILKELTNGKFADVLMSHIIRHEGFVKCLGQIIKNQENLSLEALICTKSAEVKASLASEVKELIIKNNKQKVTNEDAITKVIRYRYRKTKCILLYWVVAFGCDELFQFLWSNLSRRGQKIFFGRDLIMPYAKPFFPLAVLGGNFNIVRTLIQSSADVNCFSENGSTPLIIAIRSSVCKMVDLLIDNRANVNKFHLFYHTSPSAVSVEIASVEILQLLIQRGADLFLFDLYGKSPLTVAILKRQHELIDVLLEHSKTRVDFHCNDTNEFGWGALHFAVQKGDQANVRY